MSTKTEIATTAARLLGLRFNDALRNSRGLADKAGTHFWNPGQGGGAVIIGIDGTYLCADSSVAWEDHLGAFKLGQRTATQS